MPQGKESERLEAARSCLSVQVPWASSCPLQAPSARSAPQFGDKPLTRGWVLAVKERMVAAFSVPTYALTGVWYAGSRLLEITRFQWLHHKLSMVPLEALLVSLWQCCLWYPQQRGPSPSSGSRDLRFWEGTG